MVEAAIQPEAAVELRPKYSPPYYFRPDGRGMGSRRPLFSFAVKCMFSLMACMNILFVNAPLCEFQPSRFRLA